MAIHNLYIINVFYTKWKLCKPCQTAAEEERKTGREALFSLKKRSLFLRFSSAFASLAGAEIASLLSGDLK